MAVDIKAYWRAVAGQDREALAGWFAPRAAIRWHCTNERFTAEEFIRANCEYPGKWHGQVERELWAGEQLVTVARIYAADGSLSCHVASFSELVFIAGDAIGARDFFVRGWEIFAGNLAVFKKIYRPLTEKAPLIWHLPL